LNKQEFINNFKRVLVELDKFTRKYFYNDLSFNYKFIIQPSARTISDHLTETENDYLKKWNELEEKQISFEEVVELFYQENKMPKWVDCHIYYSSADLTIIHLLFSRQFRNEAELYYLDRGTGPFKALVKIPPDNGKVTKGDKFDINWKWNSDNELKSTKKILYKHFQRIVSLIIIPICLILVLIFGWSTFCTITQRSGLNGDMHLFYHMTRTTFAFYTGLVTLFGLYLIYSATKKFRGAVKENWTKLFLQFLIYLIFLAACEIYLQTRFISKG
jgi:hypothetical protein